mmetsp:Transcript_17307/g.41717  ORF Transcript_17307/g.41717 Transcript_17307/m.41717 type:complete len:121 (+) Transcript_17307:1480-1842(+)
MASPRQQRAARVSPSRTNCGWSTWASGGRQLRGAGRLERRKWLITDTAGQNSEVDGEGVVGQFPDFSKGTVFEYASCCPMRERVGEMRGEFLMRDLRTGSAFPVRCPTIYLDAFPPSSRF